MRPDFVDNRSGNTLATALAGHMAWLRENYRRPLTLSIATGYFNPQAFLLLADHLEQLAGVRLLLGAEPKPPPALPRRLPGEPRGDAYDAARVREALERLEQGLRDDIDLLGLSAEADRSVGRLLAFLRSGRIQVMRYERGFLHGKAYIFHGEDDDDNEGFLAGSSNFTAAGLTANLELNVGRYDPQPLAQVRDWFETLWGEAAPFDLAGLYAARFEDYPPYLILLRTLWELYGEELKDMRPRIATLRLTAFQYDGVERARRILDEYQGVIIADGVGLGKSFIAGELVREVVQERRQRALLVSPAALRDGSWERFLYRYNLSVENLSYEELVRDSQLGGAEAKLRSPIGDYELVVIDEAQAFRNPATSRARALRLLLQGTPPKQLVLLTATPVNNSLWDLYNLLSYFVGHDARFAHQGIPSLREHFRAAVNADPFDLEPDHLFDILDAVAVRRTRDFVRRWYADERIEDSRGRLVPVEFPTPHVLRVDYDLEQVLPGFFADFAEALMPEDEHKEPPLQMARYFPLRFHRDRAALDPEELGRQIGISGLLRSALLKRFESSCHAFAQTAHRMADQHDVFLEALDKGYVATGQALLEWAETDNDETLDELMAGLGAEEAGLYDVEALRAQVIVDRDILRGFAKRAAAVRRAQDPKLAALVEALADIAAQAEDEGADEQDRRNRRKALVFSYFSDTVDWIIEHLEAQLAADPRLASYRGRLVALAGANQSRGVGPREAVFGFAPMSSEAPPGSDEDRFDILVTTDVLAEGQNLQQARHIINYDLPWNPMRLVQRNGRIDRIGSPHADIYLRCVMPDRQLDDLLRLEERLRRKLASAAASIGLESQVIPGGATSAQVFAGAQTEIQALRAERADLFERAGQEPGAHSGEEYRQILRQGLGAQDRRIRQLPWAAGSGLARGPEKGHFFCARVGERVHLRFVPFDPERPLVADTLGCLRMIDCLADTPRHLPEELARGVYAAWQRAQADIFASWTRATDPKNLQPRIGRAFHEAAAHLRAHPPADCSQEQLDKLLEAVEAPWGSRIAGEFRGILAEELPPVEKSNRLRALASELGLRPFQAPPPLPVITQDEVRLVCWMAVDVEG